MLKRLEDLTSRTAAIGHILHGRVAASEDGAVHMSVSYGHHSSARGDRYYVRYGPDLEDFFRLTAWTEEEAIEKANKRLERIRR